MVTWNYTMHYEMFRPVKAHADKAASYISAGEKQTAVLIVVLNGGALMLLRLHFIAERKSDPIPKWQKTYSNIYAVKALN